MMIECDKNMIVHLLRTWRRNRLLPQGFRLKRDRPRLIERQNGRCFCGEELKDNGKDTHVDHIETVKELADKILSGKLSFDKAYSRLWKESNLRATCCKCNYGRKNLKDGLSVGGRA